VVRITLALKIFPPCGFVRAEERKPKTFRTKGSLEASCFWEEKLKICLSDSELASA
jgi:hypothetical protein